MTSGTSESQPSYLHNIEEKPNQEVSSTTNQLHEAAAAAAMAQLCASMAQSEGEQFQDCLRTLTSLFQKGYTYLFMTQPLLMRKMMNHFTRLGKELEDKADDAATQRRMLFVLSCIAELIRSNPKFYFPFTRKFLMTVFSIDADLLQGSVMKDQILAILAAVYENLSRQPKLLTKYGIKTTLKEAVLGNYKLIEEIGTLKTMDKVLANMVSKGIQISMKEFQEHKIMETVTNFICRSKMELFMVKMKMTMLCMNPQNMQPIPKTQ